MKTLKKQVLYMSYFLIGILILGLIEKSFFTITVYSVLIILGALIIAWGAESSEIVISQGLALAIVAWLQVFPEFMIEATISWAQDIPNMLSNFTGANRILTGVGWPLVFFTAMFFHKRKSGKILKEIQLRKEHSAEVLFFLLATLYSLVIFFKGRLEIIDSIVMISIYVAYLLVISKLPHLSRKKSKKLISGIPKKIVSLKSKYTKPVIISMFLIGGLIIYFVAKPFYNTSLALATTLGVSQFLFIQWVAPFLSEFPEKTSAFYWASKVKQAPMAFMNLISSKLTQMTLLLAMIPIVYSFSVGSISFIPLNTAIEGVKFTISTELLLTIATSLYACTLLLKLRITWLEALSLFLFWIIQFIWVWTRPYIIFVYFSLILVELMVYRKEIKKSFLGFKEVYTKHIKKV